MIITRKVACLGTIEDFKKFTNSHNLGVSYIGKPKAMDINGTCYYLINNDTDFENIKFDGYCIINEEWKRIINLYNIVDNRTV